MNYTDDRDNFITNAGPVSLGFLNIYCKGLLEGIEEPNENSEILIKKILEDYDNGLNTVLNEQIIRECYECIPEEMHGICILEFILYYMKVSNFF